MSGDKRKRDAEDDDDKDYFRKKILALLENNDMPLDVLDMMQQIAQNRKTPNQICTGCDEAIFTNVRFMRTHKNGYERPFCAECIMHCKCCQEDYVESLYYQHEDCASHCSNHADHASVDDDDDDDDDVKPVEKSAT